MKIEELIKKLQKDQMINLSLIKSKALKGDEDKIIKEKI